MSNYAQRTKIALKDLGAPEVILTKPENIREVFMGTLIGVASGIVMRKNPKDETEMEGLGGMFRTLPSDEQTELGNVPLESGTLFIPDAFHNIVAHQLKELHKTDTNGSVNFKFEIYAIRATNPQKRSWEFRPVGQFAGQNPLDMLEAEYRADKAKALEAKPQPKQLAAAKK